MSDTTPTAVKDPSAHLDYGWDWGPWLPAGDTIAASTWTASPGVTVELDSFTPEGLTVVWVSGGTAGQTYSLTNRVTTAEGRVDDRTITLMVRDR